MSSDPGHKHQTTRCYTQTTVLNRQRRNVPGSEGAWALLVVKVAWARDGHGQESADARNKHLTTENGHDRRVGSRAGNNCITEGEALDDATL
eukprot:scaffold5127_cov64-Phaeocystis_antarctica.AAC.16